MMKLEQLTREIVTGLKEICQERPEEREYLLWCLSDPIDTERNFSIYSIAQGRRESPLKKKIEKLTVQINCLKEYNASELRDYYRQYANRRGNAYCPQPIRKKSTSYFAAKVLEALVRQAGLIERT